VRPTVIEALRRFLPEFLKTSPALSPHQRRALWAITHCRTAALGGQAFGCKPCGQIHFAYHSCNHKACPQCGRAQTARWVRRELGKLINVPYFLVTFTLPAQLRGCFFGPPSKQFYDLFFAAVAAALQEELATAKGLRAHVSGFMAALQTWTQCLEFHPHIHCLVPGAGLNQKGRVVQVRQPDFLVYRPHLQNAFRRHFRRLLKENGWEVDPAVWSKDWGVDIQPVGNGAAALKYLATYVARTALSDSRMVHLNTKAVTFRWKDRSQGNLIRDLQLPGIEFVTRYLRHVLPRGLRSIRYYGFYHPTAKANRLRLQLHTGVPVDLGCTRPLPSQSQAPLCPCCKRPMKLLFLVGACGHGRAPPGRLSSTQRQTV